MGEDGLRKPELCVAAAASPLARGGRCRCGTGIVSIFFWQDYPLYRDFTISGSLSGSLQIDDQNRRNLIWYAGRDIGITYENGIYKLPNDAVKVVLSDNPTGIHAFPVNYELQYAERCLVCNRVLPS
jgi:hypothetical protein